MRSLTKYCIIIIFTVFTSVGFSQTVNWDWVRSAGGSGDDVGYAITIDNNGGIIVAGLFNSIALFDGLQIISMTYWGGGFIAKYDSLGNILWVKGISGTNITNISSITTDLEANIYVTGEYRETTYFDFTSITSYDHTDGFIGKFNSQGQLLWINTIGWRDMDAGIDLFSNDTNVFLCGVFKDSTYFDSTLLISEGNTDIFICSLDNYGNYLWINQIGGTWWDVSRSISFVNNDIIMAGIISDSVNFCNSDTTIITYGSSDAFVASYSNTGGFKWAKSFGGVAVDGSIAVTHDFGNNIFLFGYFNAMANFDSITLVSSSEYDYFICKLSANGAVLWSKKIETTIYPIDDFWNHSLESDTQGNIYITGWFRDSLVYEDLTIQSNGSYDIFVLKIDNNGDLVWCLTAGNDYSYGDYSRSIARDDNGNLFITGRFYDTLCFGDSCVTSNGSADIFIAKISETPLNVEFVKENAQIDIFPNPASSFLNIISADNEIQEVEIIDNNGKLISSYKNTNMNHIDVSGLPKGVYFVRVILEQMTITNKVIII